MLQNIRDNAQGTIAKIIIGAIVISFAFFGVESLIGGGSKSIATVNGEDISPAELDGAIQNERNRRLAAMGDNLNPALIEPDVLREAAVEQLVQQRLLLQMASDAGVSIPDASLDQTIRSLPQFQDEGKFSKPLLENFLRIRGISYAYFKQMLARDMVIGQLSNGITASEFVTERELASIAEVAGQTRSFQYLMLPADSVPASPEIEEDAIKAYYDANQDSFKTRDRIKLGYIEVQQSDFFKPVSDDDLQAAYQLELEEFEAGEERRVSHILVPIDDQNDKQQALAKAKAIKQKLDSGADFATLAASESGDPGSAGNGGDLGYTTGDTFPPDFEQALFALHDGEVSEPVLTDSGYHLIKATEIKTVEPPTFAELKPVLEQRIRIQESENEFVAAVEELKDLVFNSEGLKDPAREIGVSYQSSDWVSRDYTQPPLGDSRVLKAAFSREVLEDGHNSPVIELAPDHYIVVDVIEHEPSRVRELAEVKADIEELLVDREKHRQMAELAASLVDSLNQGDSRDKVATEVKGEWVSKQAVARTDGGVNRELLQQVFGMHAPAAGETSTASIALSSGRVAVVVLEAVQNGSIDSYQKAQVVALRSDMQQVYRATSTNGFLSTLRSSSEVEVY